jgi:3-deoxy-7-phosphoheptulonate synthase
MLVTVKPGADAARVRRALVAKGLWVEALGDGDARHFWVDRHSARVAREELLAVEGVAGVAAGPSAHPKLDAQPPVVTVAGVSIGPGAPPVLMAGPCGVESESQIFRLAERVAARGARFLRGGAFKPRTSPYAFQGHGEPALRWLRAAADAAGLRVVTEALAAEDAELVAAHADLVQIGSRNMASMALLRAVARARKPVMLKRGMAATIDEWLLAAEACLVHGAPAVVLCERGIRGFDPSTRNVLDLGAVALLSAVHHLPVVVDPSHAAGRRDLVVPLARAALAAGAAGLLVEVHDDPGAALSDGPQAIAPEEVPLV